MTAGSEFELCARLAHFAPRIVLASAPPPPPQYTTHTHPHPVVIEASFFAVQTVLHRSGVLRCCTTLNLSLGVLCLESGDALRLWRGLLVLEELLPRVLPQNERTRHVHVQ